MGIEIKGNKILVTADSPVKFKREIGTLLNQLMKDYQVKAKDKDFEDAFKKTFKSNLYYIIDNYFDVKKPKKEVSKNIDLKEHFKRMHSEMDKIEERMIKKLEMLFR